METCLSVFWGHLAPSLEAPWPPPPLPFPLPGHDGQGMPPLGFPPLQGGACQDSPGMQRAGRAERPGGDGRALGAWARTREEFDKSGREEWS